MSLASPWLKTSLIAAVLITGLWWLKPAPTGGAAEPGVVEISFMSPEGPIKDSLVDVVREFEHISERRHRETGGKYPRYRVVSGQTASRDMVSDPTRFLLGIVGGQPPDVIWFDRFAISQWASRGVFRPVDDFLRRDLKAWADWQAARQADPAAPAPWPGALPETPRAAGARPLHEVGVIDPADFYPGAWDEVNYTDPVSGARGIYGIPNNADTRVLVYNKDMLVRHGFTNSVGQAKPPATWEELEHMTKVMVERDEKGQLTSVGYIPDFGDSWLYQYAWQAGGNLLSADGRTVTLNSPPVVRALEFMTRLYDHSGGVKEVGAFKSTFRGDALDPFISGKVAMKNEGVWVMSSLARYGRDLNVGAAPPPLPADRLAAGDKPATMIAGWAYAISGSSTKAEHAWEFIRFLVSKRAYDILLTNEVFTHQAEGRPYLPRQYPNRRINEWVFQEFIEKNPAIEEKFKEVMREYNRSLEYARYRPVTPVGNILWDQQRAAMEGAFYRARPTVAETLDYHGRIAQRELDAILAPPGGPKITSWTWFVGFYVLVVALLIARVWRQDTNPAVGKRGKFSLAALFGEESETPSVSEGRKGSFFRSQWRDGLICASPWIIGFLLFTGGPMLFSIFISFCQYDVLRPATMVGLDNYAFLFAGDELFWKALGNTLYMLIGVPLGLALGLGMAMLLVQRVRGVPLWRTFFYLPSIVPAVASSILWIWIFNPTSGMLNHLLEAIGLTGRSWLQDESTSKFSLILMGLWGAGGGMIIWIAGIKGISESYYEAAAIDGANAWQRFRHITLPMLTPYIFFNLIMGIIGTFQVFTQAFIMTSGGPNNSTLFYVYHLFNQAFRYLNMGYASAMAWFLFLIVLLLTIFQMWASKRWVHYEGESG